MRKLLAALAVLLFATPAFASDCYNNVAANQTDCGVVNMYINGSSQAVPVSPTVGLPITAATPAVGTTGAGYPPGATPINASATGTTAGTTATLQVAPSGKITYICGYSVSPGSATTAITINITVTGPTNTFTEAVGAPVTAVGTTGLAFTRTFNPCVPANTINTSISVAAGALGTGGINQDVNAWGYAQ